MSLLQMVNCQQHRQNSRYITNLNDNAPTFVDLSTNIEVTNGQTNVLIYQQMMQMVMM